MRLSTAPLSDKSSKRLILAFFWLANGVFWLWFWGEVWMALERFVPEPPALDLEIAAYRFGNSLLPREFHYTSTAFRTMLLVQKPTVFATSKLGDALASGGNWDAMWGPLSMGAWWLVAITLLSFAQWYILARLLDELLKRIRKKATAPSTTPDRERG
jgi:hypothetical protein